MNPLVSVALWVAGKVLVYLLNKYAGMTTEQREAFKKGMGNVEIRDNLPGTTGTEP